MSLFLDLVYFAVAGKGGDVDTETVEERIHFALKVIEIARRPVGVMVRDPNLLRQRLAAGERLGQELWGCVAPTDAFHCRTVADADLAVVLAVAVLQVGDEQLCAADKRRVGGVGLAGRLMVGCDDNIAPLVRDAIRHRAARMIEPQGGNTKRQKPYIRQVGPERILGRHGNTERLRPDRPDVRSKTLFPHGSEVSPFALWHPDTHHRHFVLEEIRVLRQTVGTADDTEAGRQAGPASVGAWVTPAGAARDNAKLHGFSPVWWSSGGNIK